MEHQTRVRIAQVGLGVASVALLVVMLGSLMYVTSGWTWYGIMIPILSVYGWVVLLFLHMRNENPNFRVLRGILGGLGTILLVIGAIAFYREGANHAPAFCGTITQEFPSREIAYLQMDAEYLKYQIETHAAAWGAVLRICAVLAFPLALTGNAKRALAGAAGCLVGVWFAMTQMIGTSARINLDILESWFMIALMTGAIWVAAAFGLRTDAKTA